MAEQEVYELYYWPSIPGRGEFPRLVMEDAGVAYVDVAREGPEGMQRLMQVLSGEAGTPRPFAPPVLRMGGQLIAQSPWITALLAERHGLAPATAAHRRTAMQLQLTLADLVDEAHDTHHPLGPELYYEEQKDAAQRRAENFRRQRLPKFLGYVESVLQANQAAGGYGMVGPDISYVDLSLFHVLDGLAFAFPNAFAAQRAQIPRALGVRDRVTERPRMAAYLASPRRLPFNADGIFRHYPELDDEQRGI